MKNEEKKQVGAFIAFEGIDGSGKSTQISLLCEKMRKNNISYYSTKEPTDSPIGSVIHQIMTGRITTDNKVIAPLVVADRLDHLLNKVDGIKEKVNHGTVVVTDRYYFSSYAYHGVDMDMDWVIGANSICANILKPTCTVFLDIKPEEAVARIVKSRSKQELFETKERLSLVRKKYFESFERLKESEKVIIIDANKSQGVLSSEIWNLLTPYLGIR